MFCLKKSWLGSLGSVYAAMICCTVDWRPSPLGRFIEKSLDTNSARSADSSKSALYIKCRCRLPRRTSMMNAIAGLTAAI